MPSRDKRGNQIANVWPYSTPIKSIQVWDSYWRDVDPEAVVALEVTLEASPELRLNGVLVKAPWRVLGEAGEIVLRSDEIPS